MAAVLVARLLLYWSGQFEEQDTLAAQEETKLRDDYRSKMAQAINLDALEAQQQQVNRYVERLEKQLPSKAEMAALLSDINQAGIGRGLQFELFKPGQVVVKDYYAELPIDIKVTGSYHDIGEFAADMAKMPRIVTLNNLASAPARMACCRSTPSPRPSATSTRTSWTPQSKARKKKKKEAKSTRRARHEPPRLIRGRWPALLAGCGDSDVNAKCAPGWPRSSSDTKPTVKPLPEPKDFIPYAYGAKDQVDPFSPNKLLTELAKAAETSTDPNKPDLQRPRELLETYPARHHADGRHDAARAAPTMRWCRSTARCTRSSRPAHRPEFRHRHPRERRRREYP